MSIFDEMLKEFKDMSSLKDFSREQHEEILKLSSQIEKLKKDNKKLKEQLEIKYPALVNNSEMSLVNVEEDDHQELICKNELKKLHTISSERELTYEEAKKLEIYTKVLNQFNSKTKPDERDAKKVSEDILLTMVETINE